MKFKQGFSLLELMLVLVVLAVSTISVISYYQIKAINKKIDKAALEMQQVLQAGVNYYLVNGRSPKNIDDLTESFLIKKDKLQNPWGIKYNIEPASGKYIIKVSTEVDTANYAKQIAAMLPFAEANNKIVSAYIAFPTPTSGDEFLFFNIVNSGTYINQKYYLCKDGKLANIYVIPVVFSSGKTAFPIESVAAYAAQYTSPLGDNYWVIQVNVFDVVCKPGSTSDVCKENHKPLPPVMQMSNPYSKALVMIRCLSSEDSMSAKPVMRQNQEDKLFNF